MPRTVDDQGCGIPRTVDAQDCGCPGLLNAQECEVPGHKWDIYITHSKAQGTLKKKGKDERAIGSGRDVECQLLGMAQMLHS